MVSVVRQIVSCEYHRGYHVFKETTWNNVKEVNSVIDDLETNKLSKNVDPYACVTCAKNQFFNS